jgi:hypothetical protein
MKATTEQNKRLVLQAIDTLFNKRDYEAAKRYWSPNPGARILRRSRNEEREKHLDEFRPYLLPAPNPMRR